MKKFKELPLNIKLFIALAIIAIIGIIVRWDTVKSDIARSFNFFSKTEQADTTKISSPEIN